MENKKKIITTFVSYFNYKSMWNNNYFQGFNSKKKLVKRKLEFFVFKRPKDANFRATNFFTFFFLDGLLNIVYIFELTKLLRINIYRKLFFFVNR